MGVNQTQDKSDRTVMERLKHKRGRRSGKNFSSSRQKGHSWRQDPLHFVRHIRIAMRGQTADVWRWRITILAAGTARFI